MIKNTSKAACIRHAIERHISPLTRRSLFYRDYSKWYIGITNNVTVRRGQHRREKQVDTLYFAYWNAGTKAIAASIEKHFHKLGMKDEHGMGGAIASSRYVYVFKIRTNWMEDLESLFGRYWNG